MVRIKSFDLKTEAPGAGIEVELDNGRMLFIDIYQFLQFIADNDGKLYEFLCKQKQLKSAVEEMVFLYELGIPFDEWIIRLIIENEAEHPGWILDASYPIFDDED
jgi:hypothetical protein